MKGESWVILVVLVIIGLFVLWQRLRGKEFRKFVCTMETGQEAWIAPEDVYVYSGTLSLARIRRDAKLIEETVDAIRIQYFGNDKFGLEFLTESAWLCSLEKHKKVQSNEQPYIYGRWIQTETVRQKYKKST
ncbi:MAG: hypothetical protein M1150_04180 [Patescibacteria group bacterium]|nr:hypothetical protein [Patescibacteria group bacterium]